MFRLKADEGADRTPRGEPFPTPDGVVCEDSMSHRKNTSGQVGAPRNEDEWKTHRALTEWEADTDVMPPEYSRQLIAISRLLERLR
jgi:hypothetical protein